MMIMNSVFVKAQDIDVVSGGTLIVMVPTADGLIIAADSRGTIFGKNGYQHFCDDEFKIVSIERLERAAFVITGFESIMDVSKAIYVDEICGKRTRKFHAATVVKEALESTQRPLSEVLKTLPDICARAVQKFAKTNDGFNSLRGKQLFQVGVATFEPEGNNSIIHKFSINLGDKGEVSASALTTEKYDLDHDVSLTLFGEADYLQQAVFAGPGLQFLTERYSRFRDRPKKISEISAAIGADFAIDLIEAASKTTAVFQPCPTGIGGAVDVLLVGKEARPQKIQWKEKLEG
jgi:hypothetical protein